jgi:two-component SAPR family response regulator/LysM repeat protein
VDALTYVDDERRERSYSGLIELVFGLAVGAAALYVTGGLPHLPREMPSWNLVAATLQGSSLPLDALGYILTSVAWVVWGWIVTSLLLRLLVAGAEGLAHGALWVRRLRIVSDRVTLPLVRRAVDSALVAVFVVNMVSRTVPGAAAATLPHPATASVATQSHVAARGSHPESKGSSEVEYTVQPGDNLWDIAQRFYGNGDEYTRLVAANIGQRMPDGEHFSQTGVIQPGWVLRVPLPNAVVQAENHARYYVVQEGDTLQTVAARLLGREDRWTRLFDLNRDKARLNGYVLTDPNLIWPGLRLELPPSPSESSTHQPVSRPGSTRRPVQRSHPKPSSTRRRATPTALPATPTPVPRPTAAPPTVAPTALARPTSTATNGHPVGFPGGEADLIAGLAGAAAVAAAGGVLIARRRGRRSLDEPPIPVPSRPRPIQDFAEMVPGRRSLRRLHGDDNEQICVLAFRINRFLLRHSLATMSVLLVEQGPGGVTLILQGSLDDQERLIELAGELESRLGAKVRLNQTADGDLALQVGGSKLLDLMAPIADTSALPPLLPLGVLPSDQTLHADWQELGNLLIASMPGGGAEVVLTSLLANLVTRRSPKQLQLYTIADSRTISAQLRELPHQRAVVDSSDEVACRRLLEDLRRELRRRMQAAEVSKGAPSLSIDDAELVLLVGELADLPNDDSTFEFIATKGLHHGIRVVAATTQAETLDEHILGHFRTRFVLQAFDDDEGVHVLGLPEAADLGSGEFLLRVNTRGPHRLHGFRIPADRLDQLVGRMREAHGFAVAELQEQRTDGAPDGAPEPAEIPTEVMPNSDEQQASPTHGMPGGDWAEPDDVSQGEYLAPDEEPAMVAAANGHRSVHTEAGMVSESPGESDTRAVVGGTDGARPEESALVQIQCFGDFVVRSGNREISPSGEEGASYKAWEVLAFLASQPGGAVSKDKLLTAVWPDVGGERVTNRLHAALVRLRALLGRQVPGIPSEVVRIDRDGTCRLDTSIVASDVNEFVSLLRAVAALATEEAIAALERVSHLYGGDLLSGRGAREYEWVVDRDESGVTLREHYREEYKRATKRLARRYREAGRADLAIPLLRSLLQSEPTLEDVVRDLYECYRDLGDISSLVREDRHLRQALRDAYGSLGSESTEDIPPEPETVAIFAEVRQDLERSVTSQKC